MEGSGPDYKSCCPHHNHQGPHIHFHTPPCTPGTQMSLNIQIIPKMGGEGPGLQIHRESSDDGPFPKCILDKEIAFAKLVSSESREEKGKMELRREKVEQRRLEREKEQKQKEDTPEVTHVTAPYIGKSGKTRESDRLSSSKTSDNKSKRKKSKDSKAKAKQESHFDKDSSSKKANQKSKVKSGKSEKNKTTEKENLLNDSGKEKSSSEQKRYCWYCKTVEPTFRMYKKCKSCHDLQRPDCRYYCTKSCQVVDWEENHKWEHKTWKRELEETQTQLGENKR